MSENIKTERILIFSVGIIIGLLLFYLYLNVTNSFVEVDIDCLIDLMEESDVEELTNGYYHMGYTLGEIKNLYDMKYPKSRMMLKTGLGVILGKCSKK